MLNSSRKLETQSPDYFITNKPRILHMLLGIVFTKKFSTCFIKQKLLKTWLRWHHYHHHSHFPFFFFLKIKDCFTIILVWSTRFFNGIYLVRNVIESTNCPGSQWSWTHTYYLSSWEKETKDRIIIKETVSLQPWLPKITNGVEKTPKQTCIPLLPHKSTHLHTPSLFTKTLTPHYHSHSKTLQPVYRCLVRIPYPCTISSKDNFRMTRNCLKVLRAPNW